MLARLRGADPPVIGRVEEEQVLHDLRTVFPEQDEAIARALAGMGNQVEIPEEFRPLYPGLRTAKAFNRRGRRGSSERGAEKNNSSG